MKSFRPLGAILNMTNEAVNRLRRMISQGTEAERRLSAGVFRSIISDMITLYGENRKYKGKGILVFNPSEPTASKYCTISDLEGDLSIAQEAMTSSLEEMFQKVINFVEKEDQSGLALVAFYEDEHLELMRLDPEYANEQIDSATNGLIF
jgi:hypothetical protein